MKSMPRQRRQTNQPARLQEALVLHKYILSLLGCNDLEALSQDLKDPALEGMDEEGTSNIYYALKGHLYGGYRVSEKELYEYDQNIVRHTREINERRTEKIQWKYYQYLALLFTEIYLDRYFSDRKALLEDINAFLHDKFNMRSETWHGMPDFTDDDLNKLAFWCATGSGKTLMMHINIKQYQYYAEKYHAKKLNRILILTPNEGLSAQHLKELNESNFSAMLFSKHGRGGFMTGTNIEVIDINKLADTDGDKTVAVESFEGNNLVLVDEGHKGSGGEVWKGYRNMLTQEGFSFEYSATFGQAIAAQSGANRDALLREYGKATLFDYSYRYFYNDGYGKDYRIMNMESWDNEELLNMYLTAYLLSLYEQMLVYESTPLIKNRFLIARPLGIFVGGSVNAVRKVRGFEVSDVVQILLFLQAFVDRPQEFTGYIKRLLDPEGGIRNSHGYPMFANSFMKIKEDMKIGEEEAVAQKTYREVIEKLFHGNVGEKLHIDKQKGGDKEIGLRIGNAEHFGVINVGDSDSLVKLCEAKGLDCETKEFGESSLFSRINEEDSPINILIGSKKFSEGWSSWRVSAMGLMNVGRSEGSEIIQLFGRGVRLKGFKYSLKRSSALDSSYNPGKLPKGIREIETLNIFGVRADYMETFRQYLEDEGLPANEESYTSVKIPTVNLLGDKKLKVVRLKEGFDFKKDVTLRLDKIDDNIFVKVDWLPKVKALSSPGERESGTTAESNIETLSSEHLNLLDWNRIFFAIEQMKNERSWYNLEISVDVLKKLMMSPTWYELSIEKADLEFHDYGRDVTRWEEITIALLRAYIDRAYKRSKSRWESKYLETVWLSPNDPNFFEEYAVEVRNDKKVWIEKLNELREAITSGLLKDDFPIDCEWQAMLFDRHLFYPLLYLSEKDWSGRKLYRDEHTNEPLVKISPVALNGGEYTFVRDIRNYYEAHKDDTLQGKEIYLLRNESRKGIGFFESSGFYPDFILWVNEGKKQHVTFIDPKGIRNLKGLEDPKIQLYNQLKTEVKPSLNDDDIILDSYIISNTKYNEVEFWGKSKEDFDKNHVIFQSDKSYIDSLFKKILAKKE
jgi:hypothetical protein